MRKILLVLLILPLLMSLTSKSTESIVGEWEGMEQGTALILIFDKDGYFYAKQNDETMGGREFNMDGVTSSFTYAIDKTTTPYQLDLIFTNLDTNEIKTCLGIVNFVNEDTVEIVVGNLTNRPTDFERSDSILFQRKKQ